MDKKELRGQSGSPKKKLIKTKRESRRIRMIVIIAVLLVSAVLYYIIDSGSYVATVDGNRISNAEYQFFLSQQQSATEQKEGIYDKTDAEKKAFWLKTADGQNPWETAKRESLDAAKDYMIQLIKAKEMGLKVDAAIKSEVSGFMQQTKSYMGFTTDRQFANYVKTVFQITPDELSRISENLRLIDKFKAAYLEKEYKPAAITDEEVKEYYEKDSKQFDSADIRYIYLSKTDAEGNKIPDDQLNAKKKKAEEALNKIKLGEDIDQVITGYTEEKKDDSSSTDQPLGSETINYVEGNELSEWVFSNKPNDAGLVETDRDIYVVKIMSRSTFEDKKASVKTAMENEAKENFYDDALSKWSMEARYNIIKNDRIYDSIAYQ